MLNLLCKEMENFKDEGPEFVVILKITHNGHLVIYQKLGVLPKYVNTVHPKSAVKITKKQLERKWD